GASRCRSGLRGGLRAPPEGNVPRPRHHRHRDRAGGTHGVLHAARLAGGGRRARRHQAYRRRARRPPPQPARRSAGIAPQPAAARGYEYYAITDHSHYLREGRLAAQLEEIERVREKFPKLHILAGVEANIRGNGEVDVPAEDLAQLDWVVASVHQAPHTRPTERVLEAMESPYVDCIGHLTGRRIGKRGPRDVDVERVIEKALETGCILELNGQPDRLD